MIFIRKSLLSVEMLGLLSYRMRIITFRKIIFLITLRIKRINPRIDI